MHISASVLNTGLHNKVQVTTNDASKELTIPAKPNGKGSSVNGGELLFLALATCVCNDIYREAAKRQMDVTSVEVIVSGKFGGEGEPGFDIQYEARVKANASTEEVRDLITYVDKVAEVHNTLRLGSSVTLMESERSGI
jgi:uncharacterized OsmC-like protein